MTHLAKALRVQVPIALFAFVAASCGGPADAPFEDAPAVLALSIEVVAPEGVTASISVEGTDGFGVRIDESTILRGIAPGEYLVLAQPVDVDGARFDPDRTRQIVSVGEAPQPEVARAIVRYDSAEGGEEPLVAAPLDDPIVTVRPGSVAYHVDCVAGDDGASGVSAGEAFRSLERLSGLVLEAGDRVLLRRGCEWVGPLRVPWSGTVEWPVRIGAYGEGARPAVRDSGSNHVDVSGSYVIVEQVQAFTTPGTVPVDGSCADQPVAWRTGFTVQHEASHVTIRDSRASGNTAGVHITSGASHVRVLHNELHDNVIMSVNTNNGGSDDSGAWGIVVNGSHNEIAYNSFRGNNAWCSYDFGKEGASIEIYEGVANFVHNNVSVDDTTFSELGGSSDRRASDNVFAYNRYTSSLPGSQFLIVTGAGSRFGPTPGTQAFNNTVYLPHPDGTQGVVCHAGCGPDLLALRNNVLWVGWKALYTDAAFTESNNVYWRDDGRPLLQFFGTEMSSTSMVADPRFVDAAAGDFRLLVGSPAIDAGMNLDLGIDVDVSGVPLPQNGTIDIGAHEFESE